MSDILRLQGVYSTTPNNQSVSGDPSVDCQLLEVVSLVGKEVGSYDLQTDVAQAISLGGLTFAHVIILKSSAKVKVRVTSADGTQQAFPVDTVLVLFSNTVPFTAIDVLRVPGTRTVVRSFLGQHG